MYKSGTAERPDGTRVASFADSTGERWPVVLTRPMLAAIKAATGFDLAAAVTDEDAFAEAFFADPTTVADALAVALGTEIDRRGLTADRFAGRIDGPALEAGLRAILVAAGRALGRPWIERAVELAAAVKPV